MSTLKPPAALVALPMLADHLARQRDEILRDWRSRVESRTQSSMLASLSRAEFCDDIPRFLDRLCAALRGNLAAGSGRPAREHGAQRWQHGLTVESVAVEWGLLHAVLMDHIAAARQHGLQLDDGSLHAAYRVLGEHIHLGIAASVSEFDRRQRVEAEARMRDLEAACERHDEKDRLRGRKLHEASHDLHGSLQLVQTLCELLKSRPHDAPTSAIVARLCSAAENVSQLVRDLLDLARLEAGRETRRVEAFDAAAVLACLCDTLRPMAEAEGLQLFARGPASLPVHGDALKVKRIAQNLVLNALKYTAAGAVEVAWRQESAQRWLLHVRDSGPGLLTSSARDLALSIEDAGAPAGVDPAAHLRALPPLPVAAARRSAPGNGESAPVERHGEGIGLSIVRQLCELLDAVVEVESAPGCGTMFRILLPIAYDQA